MDREDILVDAVRKMLDLHVPEDEIIVRLTKEVPGLDATNVRRLIVVAKKSDSENEAEESLEDLKPEDLWIDTDVAGEDYVPPPVPAAPGEPKKEIDRKPLSQSSAPVSSVGKAPPAPAFSSVSQAGTGRPASSEPLSNSVPVSNSSSQPSLSNELWQNALIATMNQRLDEMTRLRSEIDAVIDQKVAASNEREMTKFRVLIESQRSLLMSRMDGALEAKSKDLVGMVNSRVRELSQANAEITTAIASFRQERDTQRQFVSDFKTQIAELSDTRAHLLSEMRAQMEALKAENASVAADSRRKMDEYAVSINRLLELQSKAGAGLLSEATDKIKRYADERHDSLSASIDERLQRSESNLATAQARFESQLAAQAQQISAALSELQQFYKTVQTDARPAQAQERLAGLEAQRSAELADARQRIGDLGNRIDDYASQAQVLSLALNARLEAVDAKIRELDSFEADFARAMGVAVDEMKKQQVLAKRRAP